MKLEKNEEGALIFTFEKPSKVQQVYAKWILYLHEARFEFEADAHESWKGYGEKMKADIKAIVDTMSETERIELTAIILPFRLH